jgi:hypothetical protein
MMQGIYDRFIWPSLLFIWLRFRIRYNQISRGSKLAQVFALIGTIFVGLSVISIWLLGFTLGVFLPKYLDQTYYFLIWDATILLAMLMWVIHVLNEAQRGDPISLDKILHLPVSPSQAFVVNYLASLGTPVFLMTAGGCLGLVFGSIFSVGIVAILFVVPVAAFLFAMTASTYWLQGWIATLMINPRTKQLVLVLLPIFIIAATQVPVQIFLWFERSQRQTATVASPEKPETVVETEKESEKVTGVEVDLKTAETVDVSEVGDQVDQPDHLDALPPASGERADKNPSETPEDASSGNVLSNEGLANGEKERAARELRIKERNERRERAFDVLVSSARIVNYAVPPLWSVAAIDSMMKGIRSGWKAFLLSVALLLVGAQFLRWSYRSTLGYWKGEAGNKRVRTRSKETATAKQLVELSSSVQASTKGTTKESRWLRMAEWSLPGLEEDVSAMVSMTWSSMRRAPEVKMYLLMPLVAPLIMLVFLRGKAVPENDYLKCLIVCGFAAFMLLMSSGVAANTFGFDRAGFRTFVLSGMERWRILFGKNLAHGTFIGSLTLPILIFVGLWIGLPWYFGLCALLVFLTLLPMFGLLVNLMAIYTPFPMGSGSIQPKSMDFMTVVLNLLLSSILPMILGLALIPLGIEWLIGFFLPSVHWLPVAVPLSLLAMSGSLFCYRQLVRWQGKLLQSREKEILRIVTSKLE